RGCRALADRRAGRSTLSGSIAVRGLRGMRLGSLLLGPSSAILPALAVCRPFPELPGTGGGDDVRPILARAAGLLVAIFDERGRKIGPRSPPSCGGLAPVTAAHPVLRSA